MYCCYIALENCVLQITDSQCKFVACNFENALELFYNDIICFFYVNLISEDLIVKYKDDSC